MTKLAKYLLIMLIFLLCVAAILGITNYALKDDEPQKIETSQAEIKHFDLYLDGNKYDPNNNDLSNGVKLAVQNLDNEYDRIVSDFGLKSFPIFELRIFSDYNLFVKDQKLKTPDKEFGTLDARYPEGSVYQSSIIFYYLPSSLADEPTNEISQIPVHEFVHLVQNRFLNGHSKVTPQWFREGSATYEAKMNSSAYSATVKKAKDDGSYLKYNDLIAVNGPPTNPELFYPTVGLFYEYLVKNYTTLKVNSIFSETGDGEEFETSFLELTNKSSNELYNTWLESL